MKKTAQMIAIAGSVLVLAACMKEKRDGPAPANEAAANQSASTSNSSDPVTSAESAAPASIAKAAAVVVTNPDGSMKTLRAGTNGWTCTPDNPATPGADPMCMDKNGAAWAMAYMAHKTPPANAVGLIYMLAGGSDASNVDPFAGKPAAGKDWVSTGPHVMVVGAPSLNATYPGGEAPDTTKPSVMFGESPYAHLMVPVK